MKFFFLAPVQDSLNVKLEINLILRIISNMGHKLDTNLLSMSSEKNLEKLKDDNKLGEYHKYVKSQIKSHDIFLIDVTSQRVSSGYWISLALGSSKPVIAISRSSDNCYLLETLENNDKLSILKFKSLDDLESELPILIRMAQEKKENRFLFSIKKDQQRYLRWVSDDKAISMSSYVRSLIQENMENNERYKSYSSMDE